jgi:hypothetical protein
LKASLNFFAVGLDLAKYLAAHRDGDAQTRAITLEVTLVSIIRAAASSRWLH